MRAAMLALSAATVLAMPVCAQKPPTLLAPVLMNKDFCVGARPHMSRVSLKAVGCCTEAGGCADNLATTRIAKPTLAGKA